MPEQKLTAKDVAALLADPSAEARAGTAARLASEFQQGTLTESERSMVEDIFRIMVKDAELRVRMALAQNLKENPGVPHDVALSLARDVESVSLPILRFSEVLTDEDLIEIVHGRGAAKQVAIASRPTVSGAVSSALVDTENEDVVTELVANDGAEISAESLHKVVTDFGDREPVQDAMVHRPKLPLTVSERLVTMVSESMKEELAKRHELPDDLATDLILQSRERAVLSLSGGSGDDDLIKLIRQLRENGRLTPSIGLRSLCMGDLNFFEASVAELSGVPLANTRQLIQDPGPLGLTEIYQRTGLPPSHFPAVKAAIAVAGETEYDGGENDRERYSRRMLERILTQYGDLGVEFDSGDLEYLLTKMGQLPPDSLNDAA